MPARTGPGRAVASRVPNAGAGGQGRPSARPFSPRSLAALKATHRPQHVGAAGAAPRQGRRQEAWLWRECQGHWGSRAGRGSQGHLRRALAQLWAAEGVLGPWGRGPGLAAPGQKRVPLTQPCGLCPSGLFQRVSGPRAKTSRAQRTSRPAPAPVPGAGTPRPSVYPPLSSSVRLRPAGG